MRGGDIQTVSSSMVRSGQGIGLVVNDLGAKVFGSEPVRSWRFWDSEQVVRPAQRKITLKLRHESEDE